MDQQTTITALSMHLAWPYRAAYVLEIDGCWQEVKVPVLGWAASGGRVYPLRLDRQLGRAVLAGTDDDPDRERFFGVLTAGEPMSELGEQVDRRVRDMLRSEMEVDDAEANE